MLVPSAEDALSSTFRTQIILDVVRYIVIVHVLISHLQALVRGICHGIRQHHDVVADRFKPELPGTSFEALRLWDRYSMLPQDSVLW